MNYIGLFLFFMIINSIYLILMINFLFKQIYLIINTLNSYFNLFSII